MFAKTKVVFGHTCRDVVAEGKRSFSFGSESGHGNIIPLARIQSCQSYFSGIDGYAVFFKRRIIISERLEINPVPQQPSIDILQ